ncbi:MAG TPA: amylo-alpha-1,6-glucosidase [Deinococcales bacterium]|nr:amylo-alpha-1,6-glucosidase [Deinococcales bacterium]
MSSVLFDGGSLQDERFSLAREWLAVNGTGGYASGSLAGARVRRYSGLLVAAVRPPSERLLLVAGLEETAVTSSGEFPLDTVEEAGGSLSRDGCRRLDGFTLEDGIPTWLYDLGEARIVKRVWMERGEDTTWVAYTLDGKAPLTLRLRPLCACRDHHALQAGSEDPALAVFADGLRVEFPGGTPVFLRSNAGAWSGGGEWLRERYLRVEEERGFPCSEHLYAAGALTARVEPGETLALAVSLDGGVFAASWQERLEAERERARAVVQFADLEDEPDWVSDLVLAADQFVVARGDGETVIAGYPWFTDWGRDTFIALPGLSLACGRPELAASLVRTFASHLYAGMIPNRFPDSGEQPEYNTVDATLWMVEALRQYWLATADDGLVDELWPRLDEVVQWHLRGTRYGIRADPADGLLRQGTPGTQLTWMDVRVEGRAITPRTGKAVEINALWYSALRAMAAWEESRDSPLDYLGLSDQVARSFGRFWNEESSYLYDVLDGPGGNDASVRPNAVIAASLELSPLSAEQRRAVVRRAAQDLLTPRGLRSLAPSEAAFAPTYSGGPVGRDEVYHQGTVWAWLIGPYVSAHLRAGLPHAEARAVLEPFAAHLLEGGVGSVSEIFDATAPFTPRGCPWQAWSVAEVLRAYRMLSTPWR